MDVTLTEFLVLQVAEDETHVRIDMDHFSEPATRRLDAWVHQHMTRLLAECEAKRRVVDLHAIDCWVGTGPDGEDEYFCTGCAGAGTAAYPDGVVCPTLAALATVYADRPGYLDEWRRP